MFHKVNPCIFREVSVSVDDPNPMTSERNIFYIYRLFANSFLKCLLSRTVFLVELPQKMYTKLFSRSQNVWIVFRAESLN